MADYIVKEDDFSNTRSDYKNMSSPGFFQPNFVKKIDEDSHANLDPEKSNISFEDIPLKEWYMHGNFLELLFKGMERNPGYTSECVNIILLTGRACANEILQKLCRTGEKMANNNLILLNRIYFTILDREKKPNVDLTHSNFRNKIFTNLNESFNFFTSVLLGNITRNIRKNTS